MIDWISANGSQLASLPEIGFIILLSIVARSLSKLEKSVELLNVQIAVIINRTDTHEIRLDKVETKLDNLK